MIISFSGRKSSGKTTLSNYLVQKGFEKISFATELKRLVSQLYDIDVNDLSDAIKKERKLDRPLLWDDDKSKRLGALIGATKKLNATPKKFVTTREALQYIGTEVLRNYDNEFHVKSIERYIDPQKDYVLDDVRFINELNFLKKMGATCIYIMRPFYFDGYSNHASEIQLNRKHFEYVIINSRTEKFLLKQFCRFEKCLCRKKIRRSLLRQKLIRLLKTKTTSEIAKQWKQSRDAVVWWCNRYLIPVTRNKYILDSDAFLTPNKYSAYWAGVLSADGCLKAIRLKRQNKNYKKRHNYVLELSSNDKSLDSGFRRFLRTNKKSYIKHYNGKKNYQFTINSPFIVEDMKLWNIEPRKSKHNKIPDCLRNNDDLFKYWLVGLIDGDGSIYVLKNKSRHDSVRLVVLASREIVDYVRNKYSYIPCSVRQEKCVENLFAIVYSGKAAVMLYNEIYRGIGLRRKWSKIEPFLKKKWHH